MYLVLSWNGPEIYTTVAGGTVKRKVREGKGVGCVPGVIVEWSLLFLFFARHIIVGCLFK